MTDHPDHPAPDRIAELADHERRILALAGKLLAQLQAGKQYVHLGLLTDANGVAFLIDGSEDTVRKWRGKVPVRGPASMELVPGRFVYDIEGIAEWMLDQRSKQK